jgi:HEAT repeat protein
VNARDEGVRDAAREAVVAVSRQMPNEAAAAAPLVEAMKSASDAGRIAVMPALAEIGGDSALAALETAARSDNPDLKQAAVGALSDACSDRRALPILIGLAKGDPSRSIRVQALRGYIRLAGSVDRVAPDERVAWLKSALDAAERPEEKRQAMGALRQCRVVSAVDVVAPYLDDADLFPDAAATIVALASKQDNRPGVQGPTVDAALDKIVSNAKDEKLREDARKLRGQ